MTTGIWDLKPTSESIWIKEKNRRARKKIKEDRNREQVDEWDTTNPDSIHQELGTYHDGLCIRDSHHDQELRV